MTTSTNEAPRLYATIPSGMITLADAAAFYGVPVNTLHVWLHRGHLRVAGRFRPVGYPLSDRLALVLLWIDELAAFMANRAS